VMFGASGGAVASGRIVFGMFTTLNFANFRRLNSQMVNASASAIHSDVCYFDLF
jgi:hypothetical protein